MRFLDSMASAVVAKMGIPYFGHNEAEASAMIVTGFIEPLVKELPMEYAVEMNRLIELQLEGSVG